MAVNILKYPGGLEYPDFWKGSVTGLTPIGSYTLTKDQALSKFPGLAYDSTFKTLPDDATNNSMTPQQQLQKALDDAKANWDSKPSGTQESFEAYQQYKSAVKSLSDWAVSTLSTSNTSSSSPATSSYPETKPQPLAEEKNTGITEEKQIQPTENVQSPDKTIAEFENKLLDQAKGEAVNWSSSDTEIAQSNTSKWPSILNPPKGPPPVVAPWNKGMPSVPGGNQEFQYKPGAGTYPMASGPRGEEVASILPPAMSAFELQREIRSRGYANPGTKEYGELRDLQKEWIQRQKLKGAEAPSESGPDQRFEVAVAKASVAPEEQKSLTIFQSEYDPQKAKLASSAAKQYKTGSAVEDPFRSAAFG